MSMIQAFGIGRRCNAAEELTAFESQQDHWEMKREIWDDAVREIVGKFDDETLNKYWEWDIDPDDAAFHIGEEVT